MERKDIEDRIRAAFANVRLGSGVSLRQAHAIDDHLENLSEDEFAALPRSEVTEDWAQVPDEELAQDDIAHLDAEGLRYYLPALMLWLLDYHDNKDDWLRDQGADLTVIGTLSALAPSAEIREYRFSIYDSFSAEQRTAIAAYVESLPRLVRLEADDAELLAGSLDHYWKRFLPDES
jgi:hypothetical protein